LKIIVVKKFFHLDFKTLYIITPRSYPPKKIEAIRIYPPTLLWGQIRIMTLRNPFWQENHDRNTPQHHDRNTGTHHDRNSLRQEHITTGTHYDRNTLRQEHITTGTHYDRNTLPLEHITSGTHYDRNTL
jgi:hypothetical protein